jgi:diphosphomevalonate decarboxylase
MPDYSVEIRTNPSLALVKYWGKQPGGRNLPATSSLAVSLGALETRTSLLLNTTGTDSVSLDAVLQPAERFRPFFEEAKIQLGLRGAVQAVSSNNFPSASGLASSSSGFAALALGCVALSAPAADRGYRSQPNAYSLKQADLIAASRLARVGSASAARAVFGGWTWLPAGADKAEALYDADYWPEFRVLVVIVKRSAKDVSSRSAMEQTRETSPFYPAWLEDAAVVSREACLALERRDIEALGHVARLSYSRMHASALAADPPVCYWIPDSLRVLACCAQLRSQGIGAWETMDAGPQVKILCLDKDAAAIRRAVESDLPAADIIESAVGGFPVCTVRNGGHAAT